MEADLEEEIKEATEKCQACQQAGRPANRPAVAIPLASGFNEMMAIDFIEIEEETYLKMICLGSRLMRVWPVQDRTSETVKKVLLEQWFSMFGPPRTTILGDRAKEFMADQLLEMVNGYGTQMEYTPAQGQHANGINERHGGVIKEMVVKMRVDRPPQSIFCW